MNRTIEAHAKMRQRNQLTVPQEAVEALRLKEGDRIVFDIDPQGRQATMRAVQESYSGLLNGVYGTPEQVASYIRGERAGWE